jgi:hypothetical protein
MAETDFLCSNFSLLAGEPLPGTAPVGQIWFLLEYNGPWENKAFESSLIAPAVKNALSALLQRTAGAKLLLIRSRSAARMEGQRIQSPASMRTGPGTTLFIALAGERRSLLYRFNLNTYADILRIDFPAVLEASPVYDTHLTQEQLVLVCTHGRRDRCCARYGLVIFDEMIAAAAHTGQAVRIWQCSHVGGHRFAANVAVFPHAVFYGRVKPADASTLVSSCSSGIFYPPLARGRACCIPPVQAAEIYLRQRTSLLEMDAISPARHRQVQDDRWLVTFTRREASELYHLEIISRPSGSMIYPSCTSKEPEPFLVYEIADFQVEIH